jgi:pimeloyl-ACP methyl ester carboxylesterase
VRAPGSRRIAPLAVSAFLVVSSLLVSTAAQAAEGATASVDWESCGAPVECATISVPVDYGDPVGPTLELAVARVHARDSARRIGSLVVNPGGPGAPGIPYMRSLVASLPRELRDRFDLVSFDPRGVGDSGAVKCGADIDPLFDHSFSPADADERSALVSAFRTVVDACARDSGAQLPHVSTVDTARDLDRVRAAIGDRKLTYVGESYGTYLGTIYATLLPDRVRAIVLDGAIDPAADGTAVALGQARGFEGALEDFLANCAEQRGCAFHDDGKPGAAYDALRARAARTGLPTVRDAGRTVNDTRFDAAVIEGLYAGRAAWKGLGDALARAEDGDASTL